MLRTLSHIIFYAHELLMNNILFKPIEMDRLIRIENMLRDLCLKYKIDIDRKVE